MSSKIEKNLVMWDGKRNGFYESYYIQCNDPVSGMAWWFRYSILIPEKGRGQPYSALWAIQYDPSGARGPVAMKHVAPISHFRAERDRFILYIDEAFLTNSHATGKISHGDRSLKWDIQWMPTDAVFFHYPKILYKTPFPKSKVAAPQWATTGGGFIRWNENEFFLSDALIHVGHVWGTTHSKNWVWIHCHGFEENPTAVFEGVWVPVVGTTGLSRCWLNIDGKLAGFWDFGSNWNVKKFLSDHTWDLKLKNSDYQIDGTVTVDPAQLAGVTYHSPDGSHRYCYNSKVSSIKMNVLDRKRNDSFVLNAPGTAAFEVCGPIQLAKYPILV